MASEMMEEILWIGIVLIDNFNDRFDTEEEVVKRADYFVKRFKGMRTRLSVPSHPPKARRDRSGGSV